VLQAADELAPKETELPPDILDANVEICFVTSWLPQVGQITPSITLELRTSSSKGRSQVSQINSNSGIMVSSNSIFSKFFGSK